AEDGIRDRTVTGVQTCALPISWCQSGRRRQPAPSRACGMERAGPAPSAVGRLAAAMRALVVTNMYPRPDRPELGSFVRDQVQARSEERRVGKECRSRGEAGR